MSEDVEHLTAICGNFNGKMHWFIPPHLAIIVTPEPEVREKLKELRRSWNYIVDVLSDGRIMIIDRAKLHEWKRKQKSK